MTTTDPIAALSAQTQAAANAARKKATDLGVEDFLALMTAQLKNQDPMKPLDSTEFVAQLAQFGTVSGVQSMQASLTNLADSLRSAQALQGASLVGHEVLAPAATASMAAGTTLQGALDLPAGTSAVQVAIRDAGGQVVRTLSLPGASGTTPFTWDGLDERGQPVPSGSYSLSAIANVGGANESADVMLSGRVTSVTIDPAGSGLVLHAAGIGAVSLADVRRVM